MVEGKPTGQTIVLSEEQMRKRRGRSIAIALTLFVLVAIFYAVTIVKFGPSLLERAM